MNNIASVCAMICCAMPATAFLILPKKHGRVFTGCARFMIYSQKDKLLSRFEHERGNFLELLFEDSLFTLLSRGG